MGIYRRSGERGGKKLGWENGKREGRKRVERKKV